MTNLIDEQSVFRVAPTKSMAKGDITNEAARAIIRVEAERQYAKTTRLREARLAFEALGPPALPETSVIVPGTRRKIRTVKSSERLPGAV
jgi:hypothetical protein